MDKYIEALSGISYEDWYKLKTAIDRVFENKVRKMAKETHLTDPVEDVKNIIQLQFGCEQD